VDLAEAWLLSGQRGSFSRMNGKILVRSGDILVEMKAQAKSVWQVQEAKTHLSEVIASATEVGPQVITRHGKECAAVISFENLTEYRALKGNGTRSILEALEGGPKFDNDLVDEIFKRDPAPPRHIDLGDLASESE